MRDKGHATVRILHPVVGAMDLSYEAMRLPDADQAVVTYSAQGSSDDAVTLRLLASWYADAHPIT